MTCLVVVCGKNTCLSYQKVKLNKNNQKVLRKHSFSTTIFVIIFFAEMDLVNVNNNPLLPDASRLQDPVFLSVVFLMTVLTSLVFEMFQIIGQ